MSSSEAKRSIRSRILSERQSNRSEFDEHAFSIAAQKLMTEVAANLVGSYHPIGTEPSLTEVNGQLSNQGRLLLPAVVGSGLEWRRPDRLAPGPHGTTTPIGDSIPLHKIDLLLVPALAVDLAGYRLGRGGGYYDRALAPQASEPMNLANRPLRIAVVYQREILPELPHEPHDIRMHGVLTEAGLRWLI